MEENCKGKKIKQITERKVRNMKAGLKKALRFFESCVMWGLLLFVAVAQAIIEKFELRRIEKSNS